ncbi:MAG: sigma-70 family RNA polymerase sigma factor [Erysipelotrichaceae bacterium]|nr:sigma-70 family RNA polymerase sigma factor [Erysipelotrichaceae bacterium]
MEDQEIIQLYFDRDEKAIKETQNKYANYCFSIAHRILNDFMDAEECLNDTYQGAWNSMPPHHPENLAIYLGKICRRCALNVLRSKNAQKRGGGEALVSFDEISECIADDKSVKEELDLKYLSEAIDEFLSDLRQDDRKIFVCRYYYFESVEEISKRLGFTKSKVKMSLKRTRDKLKTYLEKEGYVI